MNPLGIPKMIEMWLAVNIGALLVLAVVSVVASTYALDLLELFDRRLSLSAAKRSGTDGVSALSKETGIAHGIVSAGASAQGDFYHLLENEPNQPGIPSGK